MQALMNQILEDGLIAETGLFRKALGGFQIRNRNPDRDRLCARHDSFKDGWVGRFVPNPLLENEESSVIFVSRHHLQHGSDVQLGFRYTLYIVNRNAGC